MPTSTMPSPAPIGRAVPWTDLPPELCGLVMDRLDVFSVLAFPAVCKSWAAAYKADPRRLRCGALTLLTSTLDSGGDKAMGVFALHDMSTGRSFHTAAEGLKNRWWVGGKDDWLVTTDAAFNVELLNPASGDTVRLPSFNTIPGATLEKDGAFCVAPRSVYRFQRVVLCQTPAHQSGYLAVAMFSMCLLAFTAAGDECWTALRNHIGGSICYADAIAHGGKIFAVCWSGDVYYWDMDGGTQDPQVVRVPEMLIDRGQQRRFNLAMSASGQLLLVCTHGDWPDIKLLLMCLHGDRPDGRPVKRMVPSKQLSIRARGILLHELDVGSGVWRRMTDLGGDHALFVGVNYPVYAAVPPRGSNDDGGGDLRANCVYAADLSGYDAVVFDMEKGCAGGFEPLVHAGVDEPFPLQKPIWFRPSAHWYRKDKSQVQGQS